MFCELTARLAQMIEPDWTIWDLRMALIQCIILIGRDCRLNRTFRHTLGRGKW